MLYALCLFGGTQNAERLSSCCFSDIVGDNEVLLEIEMM
jgi:hypothetical protein